MNKIKKLIQTREINGYKFRPGRDFFKAVGIGQRRFWQLVRDEKSPTISELQALATYFEIDLNELIPIEK